MGWTGAYDILLLPPGVNQPSIDRDHDGRSDDWQYESAGSVPSSEWPDAYNWTANPSFIRGLPDWVKATDLISWGALYWWLKWDTNNAISLISHTEETRGGNVTNNGGYALTAFECWDIPA